MHKTVSEAVERVLDHLEAYTERRDEFRARCPAHWGQSDTSLSIREGEEEHALLTCHGGCDLGSIVEALGLNISDLFEGNGHTNRPPLEKIVEKAVSPPKKVLRFEQLPNGTYWQFVSPSGETLYIQRHKGPFYKKVGEDRWQEGIEGVPRILYNLDELVEGVRAGKTVYHFEGRKDVETAKERLGVVATTSGGASTWKSEFKSFYTGADVVIVPDNDEEGYEYARQVATDIAEVAKSVKVVLLPGLLPKGDLTDWLNSGHTADEFFELVRKADAIGSGSGSPIGIGTGTDTVEPPKLVRFRDIERAERSKDIIAGLVPANSMTLWYGAGGVAKSYMALAAGVVVAGAGDNWLGFSVTNGPVVYGDFELDATEHGWRCHRLAQGLGLDELPNDLYYMELTARKPREAFDALYGGCVDVGARLLIIDSVTVALEGDVEVARDFIGFVNHHIGRLRKADVAVLALDHQGKLQTGERYQQKSAFGTSFKRHLSRSYAQLEPREHGEGFLALTFRHEKQNFAPLVEPFGIRVDFEPGEVLVSKEELSEADLAGEETITAYDRVYKALKSFEDEEGTRRDIVEATNLADGTVKKELAALKRDLKVWETGRFEGRLHRVTTKEPPEQGPDGSGSGSNTYRGTGTGTANGQEEYMPVQRALEALRHGNAPRKAYEHMQAGAQGIESVTKSILRYYNKDDALWQEAMENVADAMLIFNEEQNAAKN